MLTEAQCFTTRGAFLCSGQVRPLRSLARRYRQLSQEIHDLEGELSRLTRAASPDLVGVFGIGPDTAATLLVAVWNA